MKGRIFDFRELSFQDGPGARVTVFFKGCPLRCQWCHNPEGLSPAPQLMEQPHLCTGCGACHVACGHEACKPFDRCVHACPQGLLSVAGQTLEAKELAERILRYQAFFDCTGGGVTFSGGEPTLQAGFLLETAGRLGGVHKAVQTCGFAPPAQFRQVISAMDYVMMDLKLADPALHRQYTGVDNGVILENFMWLKQCGVPFAARVPLIPGVTDTPENLAALAEIAGNSRVELLPYNEMAAAKYPMVGMEYSLTKGKAADFQACRAFFQNAVVLAK